jgi:hypothetical protein
VRGGEGENAFGQQNAGLIHWTTVCLSYEGVIGALLPNYQDHYNVRGLRIVNATVYLLTQSALLGQLHCWHVAKKETHPRVSLCGDGGQRQCRYGECYCGLAD